MYITGFVAFTFFVLLFWRERGGGGDTWARVKSVGWEAWVWALAAFAIVFTLLFTVFLTNPGGLWDGLYESIHYWLGQHDVGRGGEKPYFYVVVLFSTEWPVLRARPGRRGAGVPAADGAARVPGLGVRAVAGDLLVGGREVRLARAAPAAAADPAGRPRRAVAVGQPRHDARQGRAGGRGGDRAVRADRVLAGSTPSTARTRASSSSPPSPRSRSSGSRPGRGDGAQEPEAVDHRRLRRRRDVPLRLVLPRPQRRLPRHDHGRHRRRTPTCWSSPRAAARGWSRSSPVTRAASSRSASGGCASTASSRSAAGGAGSRGASRGTRPAACPSGSTPARDISASSVPSPRTVAMRRPG